MSRRLLFVALLLLSCACAKRESARAIRDDAGHDVQLPPRVTRVVSLAPSLTEIIFAVGAGDRLVGADDFSDFPAAAAKLPKVGGVQPNAERIAALRPDLVLASASVANPALAPAMQAVNVPLFVVQTDRLTQIERATTTIGNLLDAPRTNEAVTALRTSIEAQRRKRERVPRVLFIAWATPLYVAGRDTFANDLIELTGAQNSVTVNGWPQYSLEAIAANPPDLILHPNRSVTTQGVAALFDSVPNLRGHAEAVAVDENLFSRPGPRVGETAAQLNAILDRWAAKQ